MEKTSTPLPIIKQIKQYLEVRVKLLKYESIDKASAIIADVVTGIVFLLIGLTAFIFFSVTLALLAGHLLKSYWMGFGCVSLLYLLISFLGHFLKFKLQNMFIRIFIKIIFKIDRHK